MIISVSGVVKGGGTGETSPQTQKLQRMGNSARRRQQ